MRHLNFYDWIYNDNRGQVQRILRYTVWAMLITTIALFKFRYHELWKDEWQAWFVAKDMPLGQMLSFLYYEGHPSLWYIFLKIGAQFVALFKSSDVALQTLHCIPVGCALYMLIVRMRFSLPFATLLSLGYFMAFEYGVVNRGYALVIFFALLTAYWIHEHIENNAWKIALSLFFLCQTELQGVFIAVLLTFYCFWKKESNQINFINRFRDNNIRLIFLGFLSGALLFTITIFPRTNFDNLTRAFNDNTKISTLDAFYTAFQGLFANTFWIGAMSDTKAFGVNTYGLTLSCVVFLLLTLFFWSNKKLLTIWLLAVLLFMSFSTFIFAGGVRQWGMFYLCFVVLLYINKGERSLLKLDKFLILGSILAFQIFYSVLAFQRDWAYPFSNAAAAGAFIKEKVPNNVLVVAINKFYATPVLGYANRSFIEMPNGEPFTYFKWLDKVYIPTENDLQLYMQFKNVNGLVILSGQTLPETQYPNLQFWTSFRNFNLKNENYYLYQLKKK